MLDLVFAGHQQSEDLEISSRLRPSHFRNGLFPVLGEIPQQRANRRLAELVTRAAQSSGWVAFCGQGSHLGPSPDKRICRTTSRARSAASARRLSSVTGAPECSL